MPDTPPETGIPVITSDLSATAPRRRVGRPAMFDAPTLTTTVRVTLQDWNWVKARPKLQFSALLRSKIHQLQIDEEHPPDPRHEFVKAARTFGLKDAQISEILSETPKKETL